MKSAAAGLSFLLAASSAVSPQSAAWAQQALASPGAGIRLMAPAALPAPGGAPELSLSLSVGPGLESGLAPALSAPVLPSAASPASPFSPAEAAPALPALGALAQPIAALAPLPAPTGVEARKRAAQETGAPEAPLPSRTESAQGQLQAAGNLAAKESAPSSAGNLWLRFWSGAAEGLEGDAVVDSGVPSEVPATGLGRALPVSPVLRREIASPVLGLAPLAVWGGPALAAALPYLKAGGLLGAVWLAARLASRVLEAVWKWKGWEPNTLVATRLILNVALWVAGIVAALNVSGVDWWHLLSSLGFTGLALSLAFKEFMGNFVNGLALVANRPFNVKERIRIGDQEWMVEDMTFRYLILKKIVDGEPAKKGHRKMLYNQVISQPITLYRAYTDELPALDPASVSPSQAALAPGPAAGAPASGGWRLWARRGVRWGALAAAVAGGIALRGAVSWLAPYLDAGAALLVTRLLSRAVQALMSRVARSRSWHPTHAAIMRLVASSLVHLIGGYVALYLAGVDLLSLLATFILLGGSIGVAANDLISGTVQMMAIALGRPFRIGQRIEVGTKSGVVSGITPHYVVLNGDEAGRKTTILLPYSMFSLNPIDSEEDYAAPDARLKK